MMHSPFNITLIAVVVFVVAVVTLWKPILRLIGVVIIGESEIGVVNKKFVFFGAHRTLPDGAIVALNGEAGYQASTLAPGSHFCCWPWQYAVTRSPFLKVESGKLGVVTARDGKALSQGRVLGRKVDCDSYQDPRAK